MLKRPMTNRRMMNSPRWWTVRVMCSPMMNSSGDVQSYDEQS